MTALETASVILNHIGRFGSPEIIHTDQGTHSIVALVKKIPAEIIIIIIDIIIYICNLIKLFISILEYNNIYIFFKSKSSSSSSYN